MFPVFFSAAELEAGWVRAGRPESEAMLLVQTCTARTQLEALSGSCYWLLAADCCSLCFWRLLAALAAPDSRRLTASLPSVWPCRSMELRAMALNMVHSSQMPWERFSFVTSVEAYQLAQKLQEDQNKEDQEAS